MVQLRSCYFCGGVGDSLREYEVLPESLDSSAGGRSAVLCSTCHEKLRRVLEPLTEAAGSSGVADPDPASLQEVTFGSESDPSNGGTDDGAVSGGPASPAVDEAPPDDGADAAAESAEDGTTTPAADRSGDASEATGADGVPDEYYKVLRLLQNREFPMERADLTGLVTGAYDVSEPQCERILETAIERGVLVEKGSTLDLGRN
jgi:hypothetical protein